MILRSQYSSPFYWIGAVIVLVSFVFINHESKEEEIHEYEAITEDGDRT